jgi:hypothetical protein
MKKLPQQVRAWCPKAGHQRTRACSTEAKTPAFKSRCCHPHGSAKVSVGLDAIIGEKWAKDRGVPKEDDRTGQDFGVTFVVTRAKSAGTGCSRVRDFWEKGVYSSYSFVLSCKAINKITS